MIIAELASGHLFRSLEIVESVESQTINVDHSIFSDGDPVGERWKKLRVAYVSDRQLTGDDCESPECCEMARQDLEESGKPTGDFPKCWGLVAPVLAERSYEVLRDILAPYVEFLPLESDDGRFFAIKVLNIVDALDVDRSQIDWFPQLKRDQGKPRVAHSIKRHVFFEEKLADALLFRIPQCPYASGIYATERFIRIVEESQLRGFAFDRVWPPIDERAKFLEKPVRRKK